MLTLVFRAGVPVDSVDEMGRTAMHRAAGKNKHAAIAALLTMNSKALRMADNAGHTPLHWAVFGSTVNNDATARLLMDQDVDVAAVDASGRTAAHVALSKGLDSLAQSLIAKGCPGD